MQGHDTQRVKLVTLGAQEGETKSTYVMGTLQIGICFNLLMTIGSTDLLVRPCGVSLQGFGQLMRFSCNQHSSSDATAVSGGSALMLIRAEKDNC